MSEIVISASHRRFVFDLTALPAEIAEIWAGREVGSKTKIKEASGRSIRYFLRFPYFWPSLVNNKRNFSSMQNVDVRDKERKKTQVIINHHYNHSNDGFTLTCTFIEFQSHLKKEKV